MGTKNMGRVRAGAVASVAAAVMVAGCGGSGEPTGTGTPPAAQPVAVDPAAERAAVCTTMEAALREMLKGMFADGDAAGAELDAVSPAIKKSLVDYAGTLRAEAAKVADPALRAALEKSAAAAEKASTSSDSAELANVDTTTEEWAGLCEQGTAVTPAGSEAEPTASIGAEGTACTLPVTFELAADWKPNAVEDTQDEALNDLFDRGPFSPVCEIDAIPAGYVGSLRVFTSTSTKDAPRESLEKFVAGGAGADGVPQATYADIEVGGVAGAEVHYQQDSLAFESNSKARAFAVNTPGGAVVIQVGGLDSADHEGMLPAYELAKRTLTVTS